ncbi:MAG TPA: flagellar filament capping protein FliD, partial [Pseudomonadales bacterium]|nr:flagellar filament capping protein FliD [Pseudomonadales bacterium]
AGNDNFAVRVDGVASGTITLTDGTYTSGAALATEIQTRINGDSALAAAGVSVTVAYDAGQRRFTVSSASKGIGSSVGFTNVAAGVTTALGFGVGVGTNGRDAAAVADPSAGMSIQISGGPLGDRGTVTLVRGVMNRVDQTLTNAVSTGGVFDTQLQSFDAQEASLAADQDAFDKRMTALQTRLQTQFANADALISTLNNTSTYLSQQFNLLNGTTSSTKKS